MQAQHPHPSTHKRTAPPTSLPLPRRPACLTGHLSRALEAPRSSWEPQICLFVMTMRAMGVAWTVEGTGLPPSRQTQEGLERYPKVTLPRSRRRGRAGTAETGDEACRGPTEMCCQSSQKKGGCRTSAHIEDEEEVFITSGNWRGKHNLLSRGAGADPP